MASDCEGLRHFLKVKNIWGFPGLFWSKSASWSPGGAGERHAGSSHQWNMRGDGKWRSCYPQTRASGYINVKALLCSSVIFVIWEKEEWRCTQKMPDLSYISIQAGWMSEISVLIPSDHLCISISDKSTQPPQLTGTLSGYLLRILADSTHRCSEERDSKQTGSQRLKGSVRPLGISCLQPWTSTTQDGGSVCFPLMILCFRGIVQHLHANSFQTHGCAGRMGGVSEWGEDSI